jgi:nitroreductase
MFEKPAANDFPIHELLRARWSPRAFADRSVEPDQLRSLFEAARWAPSSFNEQPWAFLVARREQTDEFARLLGCLVEGNQAWAKFAPVLLLTLAHRCFEKNQQENRHAFYDVGQAVGNLSVQATALGLVLHQMAGILPDKARTEFHLPESWDVVTGIALGYPGDPAILPEALRQRELAPRSRKPLSSFVFTGRWGGAPEA